MSETEYLHLNDNAKKYLVSNETPKSASSDLAHVHYHVALPVVFWMKWPRPIVVSTSYVTA